MITSTRLAYVYCLILPCSAWSLPVNRYNNSSSNLFLWYSSLCACKYLYVI